MRSNSGSAEAQDLNGRVIVRLPRNWFGGKPKRFALQLPATGENMAYGAQIATRINSDYALGQFDESLARYKPKSAAIEPVESLTVSDLWNRYCTYKSPKWKAKTKDYYASILGRHVANMPQDWTKPLAIRGWLLQHTSDGMTVRILNTMQSIVSWAIRCRLIPAQQNPFEQMGKDIGDSQQSAPANALSPEEVRKVLDAFYSSAAWSHYGPYLDFLLFTGCRPSEAVGLCWEQITTDCRSITFNRSIVRIQGKIIKNALSKTNRSREFPCSNNLTDFLLALKSSVPAATKGNALVFGGGKPIDYEHFSRTAWKRLVDPVLGRPSTPYSCRDTFITDQIAKGKPPAVVAKWVDNSIAMIENKYLDVSAIRTIRPE
jgi:integrase